MRTKVLPAITLFLAVAWVCARSYGADQVGRLPKFLRSGFGPMTQLDKSGADRIVSIFNGLQKNLILESTRAEKDVEIFKKYASGVVYIENQDGIGLGSGAIIDAKGGVITNGHVVGTNKAVRVALKPKDGSEFR